MSSEKRFRTLAQLAAFTALVSLTTPGCTAIHVSDGGGYADGATATPGGSEFTYEDRHTTRLGERVIVNDAKDERGHTTYTMRPDLRDAVVSQSTNPSFGVRHFFDRYDSENLDIFVDLVYDPKTNSYKIVTIVSDHAGPLQDESYESQDLSLDQLGKIESMSLSWGDGRSAVPEITGKDQEQLAISFSIKATNTGISAPGKPNSTTPSGGVIPGGVMPGGVMPPSNYTSEDANDNSSEQ